MPVKRRERKLTAVVLNSQVLASGCFLFSTIIFIAHAHLEELLDGLFMFILVLGLFCCYYHDLVWHRA